MEFLLELLFDIILEGSFELGSSKKVPMPLRILCLLVELTIFFGFGGVLVYIGYEAILENDTVAAVALFAVGGALIIGGIYIAYKIFRKKKENKEKETTYYEEI